MAEHPFPDLDAAFGITDPAKRLRTALLALYGWYRRTEPMSRNVARDRSALPALDALLAGTRDLRFAALADALAPSRKTRPLTALALDFHTWQRLTSEGLSDARAAATMTAAIVR